MKMDMLFINKYEQRLFFNQEGIFGNLDVKDLNTRIIEQWQAKRLRYNKPATANRVFNGKWQM